MNFTNQATSSNSSEILVVPFASIRTTRPQMRRRTRIGEHEHSAKPIWNCVSPSFELIDQSAGTR